MDKHLCHVPLFVCKLLWSVCTVGLGFILLSSTKQLYTHLSALGHVWLIVLARCRRMACIVQSRVFAATYV